MKLLAMTIAAALTLASMVSPADEYQYIISGDPVAASTENSCATASSSASLVTGSLSAPGVANALETRFKTWFASVGVALKSYKWRGLMLYVR